MHNTATGTLDVLLKITSSVIPELLGGVFLAVLFKYTLDLDIAWRSVWLAAAVTVVMLSVGAWGYGEDYEPGDSDEPSVEEYLLRRAAPSRARSEREMVDTVVRARVGCVSWLRVPHLSSAYGADYARL